MSKRATYCDGWVQTEVDEDFVGTLTLNRAERHNALNDEMAQAYEDGMQALVDDDAVRCILIRAEGKSFCSGRDVAVLGHRARDESDFMFVRRHQNHRLAHLEVPKPIVAAVRGHAMGAGLEMAMSADIRLASPEARFCLPEINYGLLPDTGGTQMLTALVGPSRAKMMVLTGQPCSAETALGWGLVDAIHPLEALDAQAYALAKTLAGKPPMALAMGKHIVDQFVADRIRNGTRQELLAQTALFLTADYQEARAALREKRPPRYSGR